MKRVVSVSLGSTHRDHAAELTFFDEVVRLERRGVDGDLERALAWIAELDGNVDAIGLGGIDRYLRVRDRRYEIQDACRLVEAAHETPVVDGSGVKAVWESDVIPHLVREGYLDPRSSVMMVSALDRFGMAEAFDREGFPTVFGDLMFASRIPYPIRSLDELEEIGRKLLPEFTKMPFHQLYPVGAAQREASDDRFRSYFDEADIIAGDFHLIRRYMPDTLADKIIVTNTTTADDLEAFRRRGVRLVVTTTPVVHGRSFGTNVIEAALVAVTGVDPESEAWPDVVRGAGLRPHIAVLDRG